MRIYIYDDGQERGDTSQMVHGGDRQEPNHLEYTVLEFGRFLRQRQPQSKSNDNDDNDKIPFIYNYCTLGMICTHSA
jgi:hypothetical protein